MGCICSKGSSANDYAIQNGKEKEAYKSSVQMVTPSNREEVVVALVTGKSDGSARSISKPALQANVSSVLAARNEQEKKTRIVERPKNGEHQRRETFDMGLHGVQPTMARIISMPHGAEGEQIAAGWPSWLASVAGEAIQALSAVQAVHATSKGDQFLMKLRPDFDIARSNLINRHPIPSLDAYLSELLREEQRIVTQAAMEYRANVSEPVSVAYAAQGNKSNKIGQGTYSSVYKARDLKTGKIVAMKKVRFVNIDPESVRFMAREICVLRRLDHPNVMKLEALVTSRISGSLYLVFEYMEHDLAGLAASPKIKFTEPQIKCYMQQLFGGLEHCHSRGVLHRDIKGSNLLIDNDGILKIGDFGLATFFQPDQMQPLTSRVVTLWYRAPELLLGATKYGVSIDMWSAGCIIAELFAGKPIMAGRTEVEQMHKIFKLCGSPCEEYWKKTKLPHATSFKPQHPYRRCVAETFKDFPSSALALLDVLLSVDPDQRGTAAAALTSEFFTTKPRPCDPSSLPKYPPSKEFDVKLRDEEARRRKAEAVKGRGPESVRRGPRESKGAHTPEFGYQGQGKSNKSTSVKYNPQEDSGTGFPIAPTGIAKNRFSQSNSMIHPSAMGYSWTKKIKVDAGQTFGSSQHGADSSRQSSHMPTVAVESFNFHPKKNERAYNNETMGYVPKRNMILCSGPLMPPGGNIEDMLKEHERQIQEAVRKARLEKERTKNCCD